MPEPPVLRFDAVAACPPVHAEKWWAFWHDPATDIPRDTVKAVVLALCKAATATGYEAGHADGRAHAEAERRGLRALAAQLTAEYGTAPTKVQVVHGAPREKTVERNDRGEIVRTVERALHA